MQVLQCSLIGRLECWLDRKRASMSPRGDAEAQMSHHHHVMQSCAYSNQHCVLRSGTYCKWKCQHFIVDGQLQFKRCPKGAKAKRDEGSDWEVPRVPSKTCSTDPENEMKVLEDFKCMQNEVQLQESWPSKMKIENVRRYRNSWIDKNGKETSKANDSKCCLGSTWLDAKSFMKLNWTKMNFVDSLKLNRIFVSHFHWSSNQP